MSKPLVTVIMPTYKRPDMLVRAVDSVLCQDYQNIELVIANDNVPGSLESEQTISALEEYARSERVRVIETGGKLGGGAARNLACKAAEGDYLAFLDDDDVFLPDKVRTQLEFMLSNSLEMSWQDVSWYNESGKLVEHRRLNHCTDFSREGLLRAHLMTPISPTSTYMMEKALFDRTEGFGDVSTGQDWWLMLRCIEAGAKMGYLPGVHVHQLIHKGERLSVGKNKIEGETVRHEAVKQYYSLFNTKERRFIEFRHNAVLAVSSLRGGMPADAVRYGAKAIVSSPLAAIEKSAEYFLMSKR